jgi:hypothetical protein
MSEIIDSRLRRNRRLRRASPEMIRAIGDLRAEHGSYNAVSKSLDRVASSDTLNTLHTGKKNRSGTIGIDEEMYEAIQSRLVEMGLLPELDEPNADDDPAQSQDDDAVRPIADAVEDQLPNAYTLTEVERMGFVLAEARQGVAGKNHRLAIHALSHARRIVAGEDKIAMLAVVAGAAMIHAGIETFSDDQIDNVLGSLHQAAGPQTPIGHLAAVTRLRLQRERCVRLPLLDRLPIFELAVQSVRDVDRTLFMDVRLPVIGVTRELNEADFVRPGPSGLPLTRLIPTFQRYKSDWALDVVATAITVGDADLAKRYLTISRKALSSIDRAPLLDQPGLQLDVIELLQHAYRRRVYGQSSNRAAFSQQAVRTLEQIELASPKLEPPMLADFKAFCHAAQLIEIDGRRDPAADTLRQAMLDGIKASVQTRPRLATSYAFVGSIDLGLGRDGTARKELDHIVRRCVTATKGS